MATQTKHTQRSTDRHSDYVAERLQEIGERLVETARKTGGAYLDTYERTAHTVADFEQRLAGAAQNEWVASVVHAHADLTREVATAQTSATRELLR
jgi:hypothetical protein